MRLRYLLPLLLLVAGCGGASPDLSGVAQAAEKTQGAGTARFELTFEAGQTSFAAEGAFDYDAQKTRMTIDLGSLGAALGTKDSTLEAVLDGKVFYMRFPTLTGFIKPGRPWLKLDLEKLAAQSGADLSQLDQLSYADPAQTLAYLQGAGDFAEVGKDDVRGVETTHYKGTIDLEEAVANAPGEQREQLEQLLEQANVSDFPAEAWIDADGYLRRLTMTIPTAGYAPLAGGDFTMTMELFDFGAGVDIDVPPDHQVTDLSELAAKGVDQG
jgi:hypothetical protein